MNTEEKELQAFEALGMCGAMLSGSKTGYEMRNPNHVVFYNANLYDPAANKLWFGDLDLTDQIETLQGLASKIGEPIFVTREAPFRFNPPSAAQLAELAELPRSGVVRIETANGK